MKLTILGYMGAYPTSKSATSSYLVESQGYKLVIDIGSGAFSKLAQVMEPTDIDALLLTHYHFDHIADLGVLQYAYQLKPVFENLPKKELIIYGHHYSTEFEQLTVEGVSKGIAYNPDEVLKLGPFKVSFLKTIHPVPCFAVRIEENLTGKILTFTADSSYLADFITFAQNSDLLLADTMILGDIEHHPAHMSAKEVGKIAELAQVKRCVLTHLPVYHQEQLLEEAKSMAPNVKMSLASNLDVYQI